MKNARFDYTFVFEPIQNRNTQVALIDSQNNRKEFNILINDSSLAIYEPSTIPSISADLLDLAIAIHAVDRLIKRNKDIPLSFRIELPIRNFDLFIRGEVYNLLINTLEWYTNDCWHFEFSKRQTRGRDIEVQPRLPFEKPSTKIEIALWSGGLDSLAGLLTRLLAAPESNHILIGTGSNSYVRKQQKRLANEIDQSFAKRTSLIQIPYRWENTPFPEKNFGQRSRGLVFMLIGVACSHHIRSNTLNVYENGIGAINLPYTKAEIGVDQAKSVHPLSLLRVSKLASSLLGTPFQIENPFWLWTKSQMIDGLVKADRKDLIPLSSSCDRIHRLEEGVTQCGTCTSCILRRQSLVAAGVDDSTNYDSNYINKSNPHFIAMQFQVNRIRSLLEETDPWAHLSSEYHELDDIADHISLQSGTEISFLRKQILQLYSKYTDEWKGFEEFIEKSAISDVVV